MKKILALAVLALGCTTVKLHAQQQEIERTVRMDTLKVDYKTRYTAPFWSNFYIEADFAGRMLMGEDDSQLSFGKRLKPGFSLTVGKWFHPDFGVRINFGGMRLKGWNSGSTGIYAYDHGWTDEGDPVEQYWKGQGVDTKNGYRQDIKYFELNADFLFDLYNAFTSNNRLNRRWTAQGYVGVGLLRPMEYHGMEKNAKVGFRLGLTGNYNITSRLGIHASIGGTITNSSFDGELGKGDKFAGILNGNIGLSYRIGRQGFRVVRLVPQEQVAALNNVITTIRSEEVLPKEEIVQTVQQEGAITNTLLIPSVVFEKDKTSFNEELQEVNIFRVARYMERDRNMKVTIVGNTGGVSERLARRRAERIRDILVNRYGIASNRFDIRTYDVNAKYGVTGYEQSVNFAVMK
ncbi:hypothetical protein [Bacteroides sp. An51A]|uniref:hypothetical protein n=1 Tax=Bacteroides sp. An51A TaxID=1965640 RepID=UPI000B3A204F|nr:hypothetical protein [Bacteroides sp. An51A]OUN81524.1 hypothetical protein B5G04_04415 [Bacteroides sp. An51A]